MTERAANTTNQRHSVRAYANYVRAALPLHRTTLLPLDLAVVLKVYENNRFWSNFCLLKKENRTGKTAELINKINRLALTRPVGPFF